MHGDITSQTSESGPNIVQKGASSTVQIGKGDGDGGQPAAPDSKAMKIIRPVAFCIGIIVLVLGAFSVIELKAAIIVAAILMFGSAGLPPALKLLGIGGGS
jgi:hypothetical protein